MVWGRRSRFNRQNLIWRAGSVSDRSGCQSLTPYSGRLRSRLAKSRHYFSAESCFSSGGDGCAIFGQLRSKLQFTSFSGSWHV